MNDNSSEKDESCTARGFINGIKAGLPLAIGYLPGAVACGILSGSAGLTAAEAFFMSLIVFAGASQFVALNLLSVGAALPEIVLATAVLNARHIMFASSISRRLLPGVGAVKKAWMGFELTDESFSVAASRKERYFSAEFIIGLNLPGHISWAFGTLLGFFGSAVLPDDLQKSMGIAIYALLIGLLAPMVRKYRIGLSVAALAMVLSSLLRWIPLFSGLNIGLMIMLATGSSALFGAFLICRGSDAQ